MNQLKQGSKEKFLNRLERIQKLLNGKTLFSEKVIDIFYLTGLKVSLGRIIVYPDKATLFVDPRYKQDALDNSPISVEDYDEKSLLQATENLASLTIISSEITHENFCLLSEKLYCKLDPIQESPIAKARQIKDEDEIHLMEKSATLIWEALEHVISNLKEGISEEEVAFQLELYCRQNGATKLSFDPIVAFGEGSAKPHYSPGKRTLKNGDLILIDAGCMLNDYASDMTRTFHYGTIDPKLVHIEQTVRKAHAAALSIAKDGVSTGELDLAARAALKKEDMEEFFVHSLGHGIGLEVHEHPRISSKKPCDAFILKEGMVITIEPGVYKPNIGGVRYEDTIVIRKNGYDNFYPDEYNPQVK